MRVRPIVVLLVLIATLVAAPAAGAALVVTFEDAGATLKVSGTDNLEHDVEIAEAAPNEWVINELHTASGAPSPEGAAAMACSPEIGGIDCTGDFSKVVYVGGTNVDVVYLGQSGARGEVTLGAGDDDVFGSPFGDRLDGGAGSDVLDGRLGSDLLIGGPNPDKSYGGGGNDILDGRDGVADIAHTCDMNYHSPTDYVDAGVEDLAKLDATGDTAAPAPDCDSVTRTAPTGGTSVDETEAMKMPNFRPKLTSSGTSITFTSLEEAERKLECLDRPLPATPQACKRRINLNIKVLPRKLTAVTAVPTVGSTKLLRAKIDDGDVFRQAPAPGTLLKSDISPPFSTVYLYVYEEALDYAGKTCPYGNATVMNFIVAAIRDMPIDDATDYLEGIGCKPRITRELVTQTATDSTVYSAHVINKRRANGTRDLGVGIILERPRRRDFLINVTERPPRDIQENPGLAATFNREIGLGADGRLTASRFNPAVVHLEIHEMASGRPVNNLSIEVRQGFNGKVLASTKTTNGGGLTFTVPVDFTGELDIYAQMTPLNGGTETLESWGSLAVVWREHKPLYTMSGRYFEWVGDRYVKKPSPAVTAQVNAMVANLRKTLDDLGGTIPSTALAILNNQALSTAERLQKVARDTDVVPGLILPTVAPAAPFLLPNPVNMPGIISDNGGGFKQGTITGMVVAPAGDISTATLLASNGSKIAVGGALISDKGAGAINATSANLVSLGKLQLAVNTGSSLISIDHPRFPLLPNAVPLISDNGGFPPSF